MVKTSLSNAGSLGSIPCQGAKILQACSMAKKKKKKGKKKKNTLQGPMKSFILINNFTFKEVRDCLIDVTGCGTVMVHPWPSVQQSLQNCIPQRVNFIFHEH